jgi:FkbM family methyltransferase
MLRRSLFAFLCVACFCVDAVQDVTISTFLRAFRASPPGSRAVVMDVGANIGDWSRLWAPHIAAAHRQGRQLSVYMFEPQPVFHETLTAMAKRMNATFLLVAVGNHAGTVVMHGAARSVEARAVEVERSAPREQGQAQAGQVEMIDLAEWMRVKLPSPEAGALVLLKLDVEGTEWKLLPWLLMQGALCRATYILQEWHINFAPAARRLEALGLRLAFHNLLRDGCPHDQIPRMVWHDDWVRNNFGVVIPGLAEMMQQRERLDSQLDRSRMAQQKHRHDAAAVTRAAKAGTREPDCEAVPCRPIRTDTNSCTFLDMACDPNFTYQLYSAQDLRRRNTTAQRPANR